MCCYNSEKYLNETLQSILSQTHTNYELIIVDDGSTDNTSNIIKNFKEQNSYIDLKYFYKKNTGLASSRNYAIDKASNEWIAIIDHDDIWLKDKLEFQNNEILKNKNKKLFFSDFYIFKNNIKKSRFEIFKEKDNFNTVELDLTPFKGYLNLIIHGCFIGSSTVIFNKNIINKNNYFDQNYKFLTDYIFFINLSKDYEIHCSDKILSIWRNHNDQATNKMSKLYYLEMFALYKNIILKENLKIFIKITILKKFIRLLLSFMYNLYLK